VRAAANELGRGLLGTDRHDCGAFRMKSKTNSSADAPVGYNTPDMFPVFRDCVDPSLIPASVVRGGEGGIGRVFLRFKKKIKLHPVLPTPRQRTCSRLFGENYARRETSVQIPQTSRL
jgi:hypothetical protein